MISASRHSREEQEFVIDEEASAWLGELEDIVGAAVRSASQQTVTLDDADIASWGLDAELTDQADEDAALDAGMFGSAASAADAPDRGAFDFALP
jgi:hypothetical protein